MRCGRHFGVCRLFTCKLLISFLLKLKETRSTNRAAVVWEQGTLIKPLRQHFWSSRFILYVGRYVHPRCPGKERTNSTSLKHQLLLYWPETKNQYLLILTLEKIHCRIYGIQHFMKMPQIIKDSRWLTSSGSVPPSSKMFSETEIHKDFWILK